MWNVITQIPSPLHSGEVPIGDPARLALPRGDINIPHHDGILRNVGCEQCATGASSVAGGGSWPWMRDRECIIQAGKPKLGALACLEPLPVYQRDLLIDGDMRAISHKWIVGSF